MRLIKGRSRAKASKTKAFPLIKKLVKFQSFLLRIEGLTYPEIAKRLGLSEQTIHKQVRDEIARLDRELNESISEVKRMELERLDFLWKESYKKILPGEEQDLTSISFCLKIMERRAKLLGLDVPVVNKVEEPKTVLFLGAKFKDALE